MTPREQTLANLKKQFMACVVDLDGTVKYSIGDDLADTVEETEKQIADYIYERGTYDYFTILTVYS